MDRRVRLLARGEKIAQTTGAKNSSVSTKERAEMTDQTKLPQDGVFLGRARSPAKPYPLVVTVREGTVFDITAKAAPTVRDVCEMDDPAGYVGAAKGDAIGSLEEIAANSFEAGRDAAKPVLVSPIDLQAVKAAGVTFVGRLLERVIEEQARGDKGKADAMRDDIPGADRHDLASWSRARRRRWRSRRR